MAKKSIISRVEDGKLTQTQDALTASEAKVAELEKLLDHATKARKPKKIAKAKRARKRKGDRVRVLMGDLHGSYQDDHAVARVLADVKDLQPDEIVLGGDMVDCGGFLAQHHTLGYVAELAYTYQDDLAHAAQFLDALSDAAPSAKIEYLEGNHECLTPDHEVLLESGEWVEIERVTTADKVATLADDGSARFVHPVAVHSYDVDEDLYNIDGQAISFHATAQHRVWYRSQNGKDMLCRKVKRLVECPTGQYDIRSTGENHRPDMDGVLDDELALLGWIFTDGYYGKSKLEIYQSKPEGIEKIEAILNRMGVDYSVRTRHRDSAFGTPALPANVYRIRGESRNHLSGLLFPDGTKRIPAWAFQLSTRQVEVLLDSIIDGDGSRIGTASCVYGVRNRLSEIQALLVVNGFRANISKRNRRDGGEGYYALNITKNKNTRLDVRRISRERYKGKVYCLTTRDDNFFIRRSGKVTLTGNSRVEKWAITQALKSKTDSNWLVRQVSPEYQLGLKERGIPYYRVGAYHDGLNIPGWIKREKIYITHAISFAKHAAAQALAKTAGNVVFFHSHRADTFTTTLVHGGTVSAWNPGCLCGQQPLYRHSNPSGWSHGYAVQFLAASGNFLHLQVPIVEGESLLTPLLKR